MFVLAPQDEHPGLSACRSVPYGYTDRCVVELSAAEPPWAEEMPLIVGADTWQRSVPVPNGRSPDGVKGVAVPGRAGRVAVGRQPHH